MKAAVLKFMLLIAIAMIISLPVPSYVSLGILGSLIFGALCDRIDKFVETDSEDNE